MSSILDFIKTGTLDFIAIGTSRRCIEEKLGIPDDISVSKTPLILKYGSMQLSVDKSENETESTVKSIHLYFYDNKFILPKGLQINGWMPSNEVNSTHFLQQAESENLELNIDDLCTIKNEQLGYRSKANVSIIFNLEDNKDKLESIHYVK